MFYLEKHYQKHNSSYLLGKSAFQVNEMMTARYRMNRDHLTILPGPEPAISLLFSYRTGDCIPVMDDHLAFIAELDDSSSILESVVARTLDEGNFDDAAATVHMVVVHDMIRKEVLVPCS